MKIKKWQFLRVERNRHAPFHRVFSVGSLRVLIDARVLGEGPPILEVEALALFIGVCRGVSALHQHQPSWAHRYASHVACNPLPDTGEASRTRFFVAYVDIASPRCVVTVVPSKHSGRLVLDGYFNFQILVRHTQLPPSRSATTLVVLCRDIKPENVMLRRDGTPVLMDLGSVAPAYRRVEGRTDALAVQDEASRHSTIPFRAPELFDVASDAVLDQRTDVWSLGCVLYALRYGFSPFECEFVGNGGVRVVECSFLRVIGPVNFPPDGRVSQRYEELVMFALEQDPLKRPFVEQVLDRAVVLAGLEVSLA